MAGVTNRPPKGQPDALAKQRRDFVLAQIQKLSAAFRVELTEETQAIYLSKLIGIPPTRLAVAIDRTIDVWDKASMMPTLNFIMFQASHAAIAAKPDDWYKLEAIKEQRFITSGDPEAEVEARRAEFRRMRDEVLAGMKNL